jgi:hypothetical protein
MYRIVTTNSGEEFFSNYNSEGLLGKLCKEVGAKHFLDKQFGSVKLAFEMTEEEAMDTAAKLKPLIATKETSFQTHRKWFGEGCTPDDFQSFLEYYIWCFENCKGYKSK